MQHYQFHIGDYAQATAHLSPLEDLAYRRLLDLYYSTEAPIQNDIKAVARKIRLDQESVAQVLSEFFTLTDEGFRHHRCDEELKAIYSKSDAARKSAEKRWERERNANAMRTHYEGNPDAMLPITHNPLPITQESTSLPDKPAKERKRASVIADDFYPSDSGMAYAADRRLNCEQELEGFRNWHSAKGTTFKDWQAAWRTWCDKAVEFGRSGNKLNGGVNGKNGSSRADRIADTMRELRGANRPDARVIDGHAERLG